MLLRGGKYIRQALGRLGGMDAFARARLRHISSVFLQRRNPTEVDLACVLPSASRGWILEAICEEIAQRFNGTVAYVDPAQGLPSANSYFFPHYSLLRPALLSKHVWAGRRIVFFTHPSEPRLDDPSTIWTLNHSTTVISMCSHFADVLQKAGVHASRIKTVLAGADPETFIGHERGEGRIGFCAAFYPRKEPERILQIVRHMPDRKFVLMGRNWAHYERFDEMLALGNFSYSQADYSSYADFYKGIDVFVSPARIEGGPIPLIEAMMSNVVPVASQTGFAPDIISHGRNGYLFDIDASTDTVCGLIVEASKMKEDIRASVRHLSWERFAKEIIAFL